MDTIKTGLVISRTVRLHNSANGNPRHEVIFTDGSSARTATDANIGAMITNSEYQQVPLRVTLNDKGHIRRVEVMEANK